MKSLTMAAAAMFIAGGVFAQSDLTQVYDFKASVKNSNVGTKTDKKTNQLYDYKFSENNVLGGYLVVPACSDCSADAVGSAQLYVYRLRDTAKKLYKVSADLALVDVFATRADASATVLGSEAEGFLVINPMAYLVTNETMSAFFNDTRDLGNTKFWAAGFGRVAKGKGHYETIPSGDPCIPDEEVWVPGCMTLETLCGQIVGLLEYDFVCAAPYVVLCASVVECVNDTHNAVASGSWQIRRNVRMESVDMCDAEGKVLDKLSGYSLYNFNSCND